MTTQTTGQDTPVQNSELPPNTPTDPAAATPATESTAPAEIDIDAIELAAAQKALEDEKQGITAAPAPAATPAAAPAAAPAAPAEKVMIPKERLDEVLAREGQTAQERDKAYETAAYWRGIADARGQGQPAAAPAQPQQPTAQVAIQGLEGKLLEAAKRFDSGDISLVDYEKERLAINSQIQGIREARLYAATKPQQSGQPAATPNDMRLDELTRQLEDAHPYVGELSAPAYDGKWAFLSKEAADQLGPQWKAQAPSASKSFELRKKIAELSDTYGPIWTGKTLAPAPAPAPGNASPAKPALTAPAQNRLAKLGLGHAAPPDTNAIGQPAAASTTVSEDQIANMSDEQISALPAEVRNRLFPSLNG